MVFWVDFAPALKKPQKEAKCWLVVQSESETDVMLVLPCKNMLPKKRNQGKKEEKEMWDEKKNFLYH